MTSFEEIVSEWQKEKLLPPALIALLWDAVQGKQPEFVKHRHTALQLLNMAAVSDSAILRCKLDVIISQLREGVNNVELGRHACVALQRCDLNSSTLAPKAARSIMNALDKVLVRDPSSADADLWFGAAEQAVHTLYEVHYAPEDFVGAPRRPGC